MSADVVDLASGSPSDLSLSLVKRATRDVFQDTGNNDVDGSRHPLSYGSPRGDVAFRMRLAAWLGSSYGRAVSPDHLFVTAGASHGLHISVLTAMSFWATSNVVVYVEDPTYFKALKTLRDLRCRVVAVETDDEGLLPSSLKDAAGEDEGGDQVRILYTIPTFHNPRGGTLSAHRRRRVLDVCRSRRIRLIVEDDPYFLLARDKAPSHFVSLATHGCEPIVTYLGSFSKIVAPGLRCGWIECNSTSYLDEMTRNGVVSSGGCISHFSSRIIERAIVNHDLTSNLTRIRSLYARKGALIHDALTRFMGSLCANGLVTMTRPEGGFFLWISLPTHVRASELLRRCSVAHPSLPCVTFRCGELFSASGRFRHCFRVSFSKMNDRRLIEGAKRIALETQSLLLGIASPRINNAARL